MAEEAQEKTKKGGGSKLMIIVICVVMLATGGFLGLRMKGEPKGKHKEVSLKLGPIVPLKEFLVNIGEENGESSKTYLRTEIAVHLAEGSKAEDFEKMKDPIEDAVTAVLRKNTISEISSVKKADRLKRRIAAAIN